jgi:hypothetical protein
MGVGDVHKNFGVWGAFQAGWVNSYVDGYVLNYVVKYIVIPCYL